MRVHNKRSATEHGVAVFVITICLLLASLLCANAANAGVGTRDINITSTEPCTVDLEGDTVDVTVPGAGNEVNICDNANATICNGIIDGTLTISCNNSTLSFSNIDLNYNITVLGCGNTIILEDGCTLTPEETEEVAIANFISYEEGMGENNTLIIRGGQYDTDYFTKCVLAEEIVTDPTLESAGNKIVLYGGYYSTPVPAAICGKDEEHGIVYEPAESETGKPLQYYVKARKLTPDTPDTPVTPAKAVPTGDSSNATLPIIGLIAAIAGLAVMLLKHRTNG